jgi:hypothetical protein
MSFHWPCDARSCVLSGTRVGVWDTSGVWHTSTFFVPQCKSMLSVKRRAMDHGGRSSPFTGKWQNGLALPHCDAHSSLGFALNVLPNGSGCTETSAACPN